MFAGPRAGDQRNVGAVPEKMQTMNINCTEIYGAVEEKVDDPDKKARVISISFLFPFKSVLVIAFLSLCAQQALRRFQFCL
ncbi:unnamed protein product [Gongylonema pulchrum]|uniref:Uncharacterized protein n=1 Tax=Gongylonema pulchrum TaxID=637853 RepID=A0A183E6T0_9BILA|nr:unnamed protein product [Gongylonema pulchrum]